MGTVFFEKVTFLTPGRWLGRGHDAVGSRSGGGDESPKCGSGRQKPEVRGGAVVRGGVGAGSGPIRGRVGAGSGVKNDGF